MTAATQSKHSARHTTGPWKFGHMMDGERWWVGQEYDSLPVAFVDRHDWPEAVVAANLRLIAAAPDLVEALKLFRDHYPAGINPWLDEACTKARAALSKAGV